MVLEESLAIGTRMAIGGYRIKSDIRLIAYPRYRCCHIENENENENG